MRKSFDWTRFMPASLRVSQKDPEFRDWSANWSVDWARGDSTYVMTAQKLAAAVDESLRLTAQIFQTPDAASGTAAFTAPLGIPTRAGVVFTGAAAGDNTGRFVAAAGDVNGDGLADYLVGANRASPNGSGSGETWLFLGTQTRLPRSVDLAEATGALAVKFTGVDAEDNSGKWVSGGYDINGDGFDDLLISARRGDPDGRQDAGEVYVIYGSDSDLPSEVSLDSLDGVNGFTINGIEPNSQTGKSVSVAGDVNGDGLADLVMGARKINQFGGSEPSEAYVVFGSADAPGATLELSDLDGSNGFTFLSEAVGDNVGVAVSGAGDVNNDGFGDILIGANFSDHNGPMSGAVYVIYGTGAGFAATMTSGMLDGSNGFLIMGAVESELAGKSVSRAGDVNGDGIDDFLIGAPGGAGTAGKSYLLLGRDGGFGATLDLGDLDGSNGTAFIGASVGDNSGVSVSGAGDINNDGFDDLIIGANLADGAGTDNGAAYLFLGSAEPLDAEYQLNDLSLPGGVLLAGSLDGGFAGRSVAGVGDVNGDGFDDVMIGAPEASPDGREAAGQAYLLLGRSLDGLTGLENSLLTDAASGLWSDLF